MTQLDRIEQLLERIAKHLDIGANPGAVTDEGRTFAPGSGPIAEYQPKDTELAVDPRPFIVAARAAVRAGTPDTPNPTGDTP